MASNPGINSTVIQYYCERLSIVPQETLHIKINPEKLGPITKEEAENLTEEEVSVRRHKMKFWREWRMEEVTRYIRTNAFKDLFIR